MKKLFISAFAIIALCSSCGNGCSRSVDTVDSTSVDSLVTDSVNVLDSANVDSSNKVAFVCCD